MLFNSFEFLVFLPTTFFIYWIILKNYLKGQNFFLLTISYLFYGWWNWKFLFLIGFSSIVDFFIGKIIFSTENKQKKKCLLEIITIKCLSIKNKD